jgi:hypothetical protein
MTNKVAVEIDFVFSNIDTEVAKVKTALASALSSVKGKDPLAGMTGDVARLADEYAKLSGKVKGGTKSVEDAANASKMAALKLEEQEQKVAKLTLSVGKMKRASEDAMSMEQRWVLFGMRRLALNDKLNDATIAQARAAFKAEEELRKLNKVALSNKGITEEQIEEYNKLSEVINAFQQISSRTHDAETARNQRWLAGNVRRLALMGELNQANLEQAQTALQAEKAFRELTESLAKTGQVTSSQIDEMKEYNEVLENFNRLVSGGLTKDEQWLASSFRRLAMTGQLSDENIKLAQSALLAEKALTELSGELAKTGGLDSAKNAQLKSAVETLTKLQGLGGGLTPTQSWLSSNLQRLATTEKLTPTTFGEAQRASLAQEAFKRLSDELASTQMFTDAKRDELLAHAKTLNDFNTLLNPPDSGGLNRDQEWLASNFRKLALQGKLNDSMIDQAKSALVAEKALTSLHEEMARGTRLTAIQMSEMDKHVKTINDFENVLRNAIDPMKKQRGFFDGFDSMVQRFESASFRLLMIGFTIQQAMSTAEAIGKFAIEGSQLIQSRSAYETLTRTTGVDPDFAKQIRLGADSLVTELDSIKIAGSLVSGAEGKFLNELISAGPELTNLARVIAASNPDALEQHGSIAGITKRLIEGIRKKEVELFDEFRIVVRQDQANRDYAEEIGKAPSQLSLVEEQIAFLNAVMKEGEIITAQMGGTADSVTDSYLRLGTVFREFGEQAKITFATMLMPFANEVSGQSLHDAITRTTARSNYLLGLKTQGGKPNIAGSLDQMILEGRDEITNRDFNESLSAGLWDMNPVSGDMGWRRLLMFSPATMPFAIAGNMDDADEERKKEIAFAILHKQMELSDYKGNVGGIWGQVFNGLGGVDAVTGEELIGLANSYATDKESYIRILTSLMNASGYSTSGLDMGALYGDKYTINVPNQAHAVSSFDRMLTGQRAPDLGTNYGELSREAFTQSILGSISKDTSGYGLLETAAGKGASPGEIYNIINALEDLDEQQKLAAVSSAALSAASIQLFTAASEGQISWIQAAGLVQDYENQLRKLVGYAPEFQAAFTSGLTQAVSQVDPLLGKFLESASSMGADYNDILSVVNATDELTESQREAALAAGQFASKQAMLLRLAEQGVITWEVAANALKAYSRQLLQTSYDIGAFSSADFSAFNSGLSSRLASVLANATKQSSGGADSDSSQPNAKASFRAKDDNWLNYSQAVPQAAPMDLMSAKWVEFFKVIAAEGVDPLRKSLTSLDEGLGGLTDTFYTTALGAGATVDQLIAVAVAMGAGEDATEAFRAVAAGQAMDVLAKEYLAGRVSAEQVGIAINTVREQINAGQDISLASVGLDFQQIYRSYQEKSSGGAGGGRQLEPEIDWGVELLQNASQQNLTPTEMVQLAMATGSFTDAQLMTALQEQAMAIATEKLATDVKDLGAENAVDYLQGFQDVITSFDSPESLAGALTSWYEKGFSPIDIAIAGQGGIPTMSQVGYVNAVRLQGNVSSYTYGLDPNDPKAQMLREEGLLAQDPIDIELQAKDDALIESIEAVLTDNEFTLELQADTDALYKSIQDFLMNAKFNLNLIIGEVEVSGTPTPTTNETNRPPAGGGPRPQAYAEGGYVGGPSHRRGGVSAELEGGEYVIPRSMMSPVVPMLLESLRSNPIAYMPPSHVTNKAGNSLTHNNQMSYQIVTNNYYGGNQGFKTELNALT